MSSEYWEHSKIMKKEQKWTVAVSEWYFLFIQTRAVCFFWKKCILPCYFVHITAKNVAQLHFRFLFSGTADEIVAWSSVLGVSWCSAGHCSLWSCVQLSVCLWVLFATGLRSVLHLGQNQKAELGWCTVLLKWCCTEAFSAPPISGTKPSRCYWLLPKSL